MKDSMLFADVFHNAVHKDEVITREDIEKKVDFSKKGKYISFRIDLPSGTKGVSYQTDENDVKDCFRSDIVYSPIEMMINTALRENEEMKAKDILTLLRIEIKDENK